MAKAASIPKQKAGSSEANGGKPAPLSSSAVVHIALLLALCLGVYWGTLQASFHFDDVDYIVNNRYIKDFGKLIDGPSEAERLRLSSNLRTNLKTRFFTYATFWMNHKTGGLNPYGFHAVNLAIHFINSIFVYLLVKALCKTPLLKSSKLSARSPYIALLASALFAVHPVQTQAVSYVSQRFTSLVALFYLLTVIMYIKWRVSDDQGRPVWSKNAACYFVAIISAIAAVKTKESAFTIPLMLLMTDIAFFGFKKEFKRYLWLLPFVLISASIPLSLMGAGEPLSALTAKSSRWLYLLTSMSVMLTYLRLLVLPVNQNLDYDYPLYESFANPFALLSLLIVAGAAVFALYSILRPRISLKIAGFGILWILIALSVENGIIVLDDVINEHRIYLPSIGLFICLAVFAISYVETHKNIVIGVCIAVIFAMSIAAHSRNKVWRDEITLWGDTVKKSPIKGRALFNLGAAYQRAGMNFEALDYLNKALKVNPKDVDALNNLGLLYQTEGQTEKAVATYSEAIKIKPDDSELFDNLGLAYMARNDFENAEKSFLGALKAMPENSNAHHNLGALYGMKGMTDKAIHHLETAYAINPEDTDILLNLAKAYEDKGLFEKAEKFYLLALKLNPGFAPAHFRLGGMYTKLGRTDEGKRHLDIASSLGGK